MFLLYCGIRVLGGLLTFNIMEKASSKLCGLAFCSHRRSVRRFLRYAVIAYFTITLTVLPSAFFTMFKPFTGAFTRVPSMV